MSGSLATNLDANGNGLTALDYRKILQGFYPNPGIVKGGTVTGNSSLTYHVEPTVAVIDRGSDGTRLVYFEGGDTPAVTAGDASNRRIDVIWLKANDPALDGGSKEVVLGVTQGTPSANPDAPQLDSGKLALMEKMVQPGATNLSTGSGNNRSYNYAIPYGTSIGPVASASENQQYTVLENIQSGKMVWYQKLAVQFSIPSDRRLELSWEAASTVGAGTGDFTNAREGSYFIQLRLDGVVVNDSPANTNVISGNAWEITSDRYAEMKKKSMYANVTAGTHSLTAWITGNPVSYTYPVTLVGQRHLRVEDKGVAK